jgi:hypothetical protein
MEEVLQLGHLQEPEDQAVAAKDLILLAPEQPEQAAKDSQAVTDLQSVAALMVAEEEEEVLAAQEVTHRPFILAVMVAAA